jgi:DNA-binding transcriptional LysR family regulator
MSRNGAFLCAGNGMQRTFEGSSLETIRHMVASGIGLTVLPRASVPDMDAKDGMLQFRPFDEPAPSRRVVIVWRKASPARPPSTPCARWSHPATCRASPPSALNNDDLGQDLR